MATSKSKHQEGSLAESIEEQTIKIPSDTFLWAAIGSMSASLILKLFGKNHESLFIGHWAAPFLLLGIYNKLVKIDRGIDESDD
jgi:hypothetical protein